MIDAPASAARSMRGAMRPRLPAGSPITEWNWIAATRTAALSSEVEVSLGMGVREESHAERAQRKPKNATKGTMGQSRKRLARLSSDVSTFAPRLLDHKEITS